MTYNFNNLSFADFEDLARDLIGKELGIRFEAFCPGPDEGIDGRHAQSNSNVILQAKHYEGSRFSKLRSAMKRERKSIDILNPTRYLLATSCKLTPRSKASLAALIGPSLKSQADIFGPEDLNGLLRKYPLILKAHIKLWLAGVEVLERVIRSAAHTYASITKEDIKQKVRVFASNPSFDQSLKILKKHHVLIISGPPGVGKTTLAEMLSYTFLSENWELIPIRSLDDGFAAINDGINQVFLFDDFLGRIALDKQALAHKDSDIARFMSRIRRSPNARFILTTRGHIFEEARRISEHLGDERLDVSKYVLDVGIYTRRIKARILYNHLLVAETPKTHIRALIESEILAAIIDHRNYNPRVIEAMTDGLRVGEIKPSSYPTAFLAALKNPSHIWDTAYRTHIDRRCQHLLIAMFFLSEYGVSISKLRTTYDSLHASMSSSYGLSHDPKDFEEALRILEGSFISIKGDTVSFVNPSLKDYLFTYLSDPELLAQLAPAAKFVDWIENVWDMLKQIETSSEQIERIARACVGLINIFEKNLTWKPKRLHPSTLEYNDASNARRLELLFEWWQITGDIRFADSIMTITNSPQQGFSPWSDSEKLIGFFAQLQALSGGKKFIYEEQFLTKIEEILIDIIGWASSDALTSLVDSVDEAADALPNRIMSALEEAVHQEFVNIGSRISDDESESSLNDRIEALKIFAPRFGIPSSVLQSSVSRVKDRISELEEITNATTSPSFSLPKGQNEKFDNEALKNLFTSLLDG